MNLIKTRWALVLLLFITLTPVSPVYPQNNPKLEGIEHPYLFFSKSDLPELRDRVECEPFLTRWKVFLKNADEVLGTEPVHYFPGRSNMGRSRKHLENAGKTSFAYIITGEEKYADRAIGEAMAMIDGVIPTEQGEFVWYTPRFRDWNRGADLNTAEICYALAMVYDWCYDALSGDERKRIREALLDKGIRHFLVSIEGEHPDFWVGNPVSNWAGVVNGGVGLAALALYNESETARKAAGYARENISQFLDHVFLQDGGGHEGIMYARYGELFGLYFMMAEQRLFGLDLHFMEELNRRMAGYWDIYLQAPDTRYANFNNMGESTFEGLWGKNHRDLGGPNSDLCALMETLAPEKDPLLLWAADNGAPRFYWDGASPWFFLWRSEEAGPVPPEAKPDLQEAVLFRGAGHAIFQSDRLWVAFNGGWTSDRSHNNRDLGSFILVADQERLVNDPGYGDGDASCHSTVTINGEDQIKARLGKYLRFGSGETFHYLASDLTDAYDDETLDHFIRHLLFAGDGYLVLMDEIGVKNGGEPEWRLQTRCEAEVLDGRNALIHGKKHELYVIDAGDQMYARVVGWEGKNGRLNAVSKTPVIPKQDYLFISVLYPVQDVEGSAAPPPAVSLEQGVLTIQKPEGNRDVIRFSDHGNRWVLDRFNEECATAMGDGSTRTLETYRKEGGDAIRVDDLPAWFLPVTER